MPPLPQDRNPSAGSSRARHSSELPSQSFRLPSLYRVKSCPQNGALVSEMHHCDDYSALSAADIPFYLVAQAAINGAGSLGMISAPLIIGALSKRDLHQGWRTFYVRILELSFFHAPETYMSSSGSRLRYGVHPPCFYLSAIDLRHDIPVMIISAYGRSSSSLISLELSY